MRDLRIVFMGTPDFAVPTLDILLRHSYEVAGVITAPDKPAGRGRRLQMSAVKKYALANDLKVLQPANLKDTDFLEELKSLNANLQIVVAFRMLPKAVWQMPEFGTFNLHASLLPDYRGAAPINWAIINGEKITGVTTFFIDEKIDTGAVILQKKTTIGPHETAGELHDKLMVLGAALVLETTKKIQSGPFATEKQKDIQALKPAPKIDKDTCKIDWNKSVNDVYNHIRGLSPYPTAWTTLHNNDKPIFLKIYEVMLEVENHQLEPGTLIAGKKKLRVAAKGGFIELLEIQLPGKRRMAVTEVLNGLDLSKSAYLS